MDLPPVHTIRAGRAANAACSSATRSYGTARLIEECLVQSAAYRLALFPALPAAWGDGSAEGLGTRCRVVVTARRAARVHLHRVPLATAQGRTRPTASNSPPGPAST